MKLVGMRFSLFIPMMIGFPSTMVSLSSIMLTLIRTTTSTTKVITRDITKLSRIYVQDSLKLDTQYQIDEKNSHYITNVMRLKIGQSFRIFNGHDGEYICDLGI
jgi:hypothetical protein